MSSRMLKSDLAITSRGNSVVANVGHYISIARPDHWVKNVFMLFGTAMALVIHYREISLNVLGSITVGLVATCLIASSNYVINELLDAPQDLEHPEKKFRPIPRGLVSKRIAYMEWLGLGAFGLLLAWSINLPFFLSGLALWVMGVIYNVPPVRSKEIPILDVLSEAINNPIRLLLGWYAAGILALPPSSILISYWLLGSFFMAAKRLGEYRDINDVRIASSYRHSFKWYNENRLIISMMIFGCGFMFFFAVVMTKYHPELILSAPFFMILLGYITKLSFEPQSIIQHPERLLRKPFFLAYALLCVGLLFILSIISIPSIESFLGLEGRKW